MIWNHFIVHMILILKSLTWIIFIFYFKITQIWWFWFKNQLNLAILTISTHNSTDVNAASEKTEMWNAIVLRHKQTIELQEAQQTMKCWSMFQKLTQISTSHSTWINLIILSTWKDIPTRLSLYVSVVVGNNV